MAGKTSKRSKPVWGPPTPTTQPGDPNRYQFRQQGGPKDSGRPWKSLDCQLEWSGGKEGSRLANAGLWVQRPEVISPNTSSLVWHQTCGGSKGIWFLLSLQQKLPRGPDILSLVWIAPISSDMSVPRQPKVSWKRHKFWKVFFSPPNLGV